jgi:hypothetical protein
VGSIQVSARNLAPTTITITAMTPMPVLSVSDYMYDFEMFATTWDFDVWNSGDAGSTLSFTVATDRNWLSATPTISTSTGSGDRKAITVTVNRTLLTSGRNTGVISISSPGRSPVNITVSATKPAPVIACSASNHDFGTSENQWTFDVWNSDTNGSSLSVQVADDQEWMNATPITVTSSGPADRKEVTVTLDRAELPAGSTGGTISLSGPGLSTWNIHVSAAKSKSVWVNSASKAETPDGASIASAYPTISEGVKGAAAQAVSEVWVVGGEYMETATLHDTIAVYGGFAGTEADRDDRDWVANPCVVDAANEGPCVAAASGATLDGFTLQNGAALADSVLVAPGDSGVTVENCVFAASGDVWSVKANN